MGRFEGKVAVVTGSDSGIGQSILVGFAKEGASVVVHGIDDKLVDETVELLKAAKVDESKILKIIGFFDDDSVLKNLIDETIAKFGRLDILVNNAGVFKKPGIDHFKEAYSTENIDFVFQINTRAPFLLTELALPHLEKTKGCIINTCSAAGFDMNGKQTYFIAYATTKAALLTFTKIQAVRCEPLGVRVNAVCPGTHESPFTTRPFNYLATEEDRARYAAHKARVCSRIPVGDYGQIPDLVQTYLNLAAADHITGAIWIQDGGRLNWAPETECLP